MVLITHGKTLGFRSSEQPEDEIAARAAAMMTLDVDGLSADDSIDNQHHAAVATAASIDAAVTAALREMLEQMFECNILMYCPWNDDYDPVIASDGRLYHFPALQEWVMKEGMISPYGRVPLEHAVMAPLVIREQLRAAGCCIHERRKPMSILHAPVDRHRDLLRVRCYGQPPKIESMEHSYRILLAPEKKETVRSDDGTVSLNSYWDFRLQRSGGDCETGNQSGVKFTVPLLSGAQYWVR